MTRTILTLVPFLLASAGARAESLPLVTPPPGYTLDGTPVSFPIEAPGISNLTAFTLQFLVTAGPTGFAPDLTIGVAPPSDPANYPFLNVGTFNAMVLPVPGANSYLVTISDSVPGGGFNTVAGVNDQLASATIRPGITLTGPITVRFTRNDFVTSPATSYDLPPPFTIPMLPDQPPLVPVPAPPAWVLLAIGIFGFSLSRLRSGRPQARIQEAVSYDLTSTIPRG